MAVDRFVHKVFNMDALRLLRALPTACIDADIVDGMYGTGRVRYEWGTDPGANDPVKHWRYHEPYYRECLRVLRPGGVLAWAQSIKFYKHFDGWFGGHRVWSLPRLGQNQIRPSAHVWVVQTRERRPVELVGRDPVVLYGRLGRGLKATHPCIKPVEELAFLVGALTEPGDVVLDCFCGLGSTLLAAEQLGRKWIGCDLGKTYCQVALKRLWELRDGCQRG
jgi:hypothetical protein